MDPASEARLALVIPDLAALIRPLYETLLAQGISIRVVQGLRKWEDQARLYAQGRTAPGAIVTYAPPGHSMHEFGLAVDCMPSLYAPDQKWVQDGVAGSPRYVAMVAAAESLGLASGSRWSEERVDWPHLQMPNMPVSPTARMRGDFSGGGLPLVWQNYAAGVYGGTQ